MESRCDPRGSLPHTMIQPIYHSSRSPSNLLDRGLRRSSTVTLHRPRRKQCYDWIFSSATNVHIAIDKAVFKTYTPFASYALTMADNTKITVKGIGKVELKIRCKPGSKSDRTIVLDNVLHIPTWLCNIFSDIYFMSVPGFEHSWTQTGISFMLQEKGKSKHFGYTESFCGQDRLVLSRKSDGRSPMLEDHDREVFSINLTWPQSQQDQWIQLQARIAAGKARKLAGTSYTEHYRSGLGIQQQAPGLHSEPRIRLGEINENIAQLKSTPSKRLSSLKATVSSMGLYYQSMRGK